ncbi:MAG: hypothetical protein AB1529_04580 [Candidatus Micrarchaeota archaeon]
MRALIIALALVVFLAGCAQTGGDYVPAKLGEPFRLKLDQTAYIQSENLYVKLTDIPQDSRCPSDVTCIRAGDTTVVLSVKKGSVDLGTVRLTSENSVEASGEVGGYSVSFLAVEPYPVSTDPIQREEYVVTLRVTK